MSARRLAIRQPESFKLSVDAVKEIDAWVARAVGDKLGMAYIRVYEVATFYTMFALEPVGTHFVQMCGTTPCWLRGSDELKGMLARKIGPQKTLSADGKLSWLEVECLGSCANAPMVQISNAEGDHYYEDLTAESLEAILDAFVAGETPKTGPQNERHTSEPEGGAIALTETVKQDKLRKIPNAAIKAEVLHHAGASKASRAKKAPVKAKPAKAKMKPKAKVAPKPAAKKPQVIYKDGPTDGAPDDLKLVKGIGPKFEGDLNSKGIYYFRQIAAWKVADVKMVEDLIDSIPGRIKRDEWVKQAKVLAKGGAPRKMKSPRVKKGKA